MNRTALDSGGFANKSFGLKLQFFLFSFFFCFNISIFPTLLHMQDL